MCHIRIYIPPIPSIIMAQKITTIKLTKSTVKKLAKLGDKGDTYEDIILRLLEATK